MTYSFISEDEIVYPSLEVSSLVGPEVFKESDKIIAFNKLSNKEKWQAIFGE